MKRDEADAQFVLSAIQTIKLMDELEKTSPKDRQIFKRHYQKIHMALNRFASTKHNINQNNTDYSTRSNSQFAHK